MEQDCSVISHNQYLFSYSLIQKVFLVVLLILVFKTAPNYDFRKKDYAHGNLEISPPGPNFAFPRTYVSAHVILERGYVSGFLIFSFPMQNPRFP